MQVSNCPQVSLNRQLPHCDGEQVNWPFCSCMQSGRYLGFMPSQSVLLERRPAANHTHTLLGSSVENLSHRGRISDLSVDDLIFSQRQESPQAGAAGASGDFAALLLAGVEGVGGRVAFETADGIDGELGTAEFSSPVFCCCAGALPRHPNANRNSNENASAFCM